MQVKDIMTKKAEYITPDTSLREAARQMQALDCGFLAISDDAENRLSGVITDRDIVIRAVAEGENPDQCRVSDIRTGKVLYCFEDDNLQHIADNMSDQQVSRLIVLNNRQDKQLCGVVTLGDIIRAEAEHEATKAAEGIKRAA